MKTGIACIFFLFFLVGCAAEENKITTFEMIPAASVVPMEEVGIAFEILDAPLAHYYRLADDFSKKLEHCSPSATEEMKILDKCFQGIKFCFQVKWKEIYDNPETAVSEAKKLLPIIFEAIKDLEDRLEMLEMEIKSGRRWVRFPFLYPTP